jgi:hypothetical protein
MELYAINERLGVVTSTRPQRNTSSLRWRRNFDVGTMLFIAVALTRAVCIYHHTVCSINTSHCIRTVQCLLTLTRNEPLVQLPIFVAQDHT